MLKLTIQNRLIAFIVMPVVAFAIMVVTALGVISYTEDNMEAMYVDRIEPLAGLKEVVDQYAVSVVDAANKVNVGIATPREAINDIREAERVIQDRWGTYMQTTLTEEEARLAGEAETLFVAANQGKDRIIERLQELDGRSTGALNNDIPDLYTAIDPISDQFNELIDLQLREARLTTDEVVGNAQQAMVWFFVVSVIAALLLIVFGVWTMRAINRPLANITRVIDQVEHDNDLTVRVEVERDDEIGRVGRELNRLLSEFEGTVGELNSAITQLASSSEEMSAISSQSSQGMSKQQEQTEMVATAMNEMTATVQEVARNASDAANSTQQADERAKYGEEVVGKTRDRIMQFAELFEHSTSSVEKLNEQSEQIGSVIEVISSIADQTNLLALNAAIEAARAGEHGRGFAVVAEEVRSLASRTQNSTVEISDMIEKLQSGVKNTVDSMNQGKEMAGQSVDEAGRAGDALTDISQAVDQVNEMNMQIASAAEEQSAVAEEINQRITAINDVGQETQESASQSAIASQELAQLSSELQKLAERYKVSASKR